MRPRTRPTPVPASTPSDVSPIPHRAGGRARRLVCVALLCLGLPGAAAAAPPDPASPAAAAAAAEPAASEPGVPVPIEHPPSPDEMSAPAAAATPAKASWFHRRAPHVRQAWVAAANPMAVDAGLEILGKGGKAIEAAVAVQAMLGLVEPQSSGIGGGSFL